MNRTIVWTVAKKDLSAIRTNIQVWLPMAILPVVLGVLVPAGALLGLRFSQPPPGVQLAAQVAKTQMWLARYPPELQALLDGMPSLNAQVAWIVCNYLFSPMILIMPLMVGNLMATESFVGERERGTLEALLLTPATLVELFTGKVAAALLAALTTAWTTFLLQVVVVNAFALPWVERYFFPAPHFAAIMLLLVPATALAAVLAGVFISARVKTFQAAYQLGGILVLPVVGLVAGQAAGLVMLDGSMAFVLGLAMVALDAALLGLLGRRLKRDQLATTWI